MPRTKNDSRRDEWIAEYFRNGGRKKLACDATGIAYSTLKFWLKDETFLERMAELRDVWADSLRAAAMKRAMEKSDTLLIFMLKALEPERYDDEVRRAKWLADTGTQDPDATPINVVLLRGDAPEGVEEPAVVETEQ